jgi:uncharacterized membrane protein YheB (UPF0754 family)
MSQGFQTEFLVLVLIPVVSGAIGWFAGFIAVKMLFRPVCPVTFMGMRFQGLLPRRHKELAASIADAIAHRFLTRENIIDFMKSADTERIMKNYVTAKWNERIDDVLAVIPMAQMLFSKERLNGIRDKIADAFSGSADEFIKRLADNLAENNDLEKAVRENIMSLDAERLGTAIKKYARREFRYIERLAGIFGFIIGILQSALVILIF